jgi:hypothetical protein
LLNIINCRIRLKVIPNEYTVTSSHSVKKRYISKEHFKGVIITITVIRPKIISFGTMFNEYTKNRHINAIKIFVSLCENN